MRKPLFLVLWTVLFALYFIFWDCPNAVRIVLKALPEILIIVAILCNRKAIGRRTLVPVTAALVLSVLGDTAGEFKFGEIIDIVGHPGEHLLLGDTAHSCIVGAHGDVLQVVRPQYRGQMVEDDATGGSAEDSGNTADFHLHLFCGKQSVCRT